MTDRNSRSIRNVWKKPLETALYCLRRLIVGNSRLNVDGIADVDISGIEKDSPEAVFIMETEAGGRNPDQRFHTSRLRLNSVVTVPTSASVTGGR